MRVMTVIKVLNKRSSIWQHEGVDRESFKITYSQDDDNIVGEITVRKEVFETIEKGKEFEILGEYIQTKNSKYISWLSAKPVFNNGKAVV